MVGNMHAINLYTMTKPVAKQGEKIKCQLKYTTRKEIWRQRVELALEKLITEKEQKNLKQNSHNKLENIPEKQYISQ